MIICMQSLTHDVSLVDGSEKKTVFRNRRERSNLMPEHQEIEWNTIVLLQTVKLHHLPLMLILKSKMQVLLENWQIHGFDVRSL